MSFLKCNSIRKGDIIRVQRAIGYYHFGIAISDTEIIHFSGDESDSINKAKEVKIRRTTLTHFLKDDQLEVNYPFDSNFTREEIVERAFGYLEQDTFLGKPYNLISNNCEHFARYIYYGDKISNQVTTVAKALSAAAILGITSLGITIKNNIKKANNQTFTGKITKK